MLRRKESFAEAISLGITWSIPSWEIGKSENEVKQRSKKLADTRESSEDEVWGQSAACKHSSRGVRFAEEKTKIPLSKRLRFEEILRSYWLCGGNKLRVKASSKQFHRKSQKSVSCAELGFQKSVKVPGFVDAGKIGSYDLNVRRGSTCDELEKMRICAGHSLQKLRKALIVRETLKTFI